MISFKILTEQVKDELLEQIKRATPDADITFASDNMTLLLEGDDEEIEYAVTYAHGCLMVRVFDGEYLFMYPLKLSKSSDPLAAAMEIRAYAVKEEIPLVYCDVPRAEVGELATSFRHLTVDSDDPKDRFFTLRVSNELDLMDEEPSYFGYHDVAVTPLEPSDDEDYFRLCTDKATNVHWGYDYSADEPNPAKDYFREVAEGEFCRGAALSLAVRAKQSFVGEVTLYYFDFKGGCECAVRILPEYWGKGYATEALRAIKTLAKRMGLVYLYATVSAENKASIGLCEKMFNYSNKMGKNVRFTAKL